MKRTRLLVRVITTASVVTVVAAGALTVPAQAMTPAAPITGWKLGLAYGLDDTPIYPLILVPAKKQAEKLGVSIVEGSAQSKCENQVQNIRDMISSGVKAVTFLGLCGDGSAYEQVVAEGKSKGVTMVSYAFVMPGADGSIVFNDKQAGTKMANDALAWAKAKFGAKKYKDFSWGLLECSFAPPSIQQRYLIPKQVITKATGKAPLTADCANDPASAQKVVQTWLQKDKGLDMVLGFVDSGALGAYQAYKRAGAKPGSVYVAGIDGQTEALLLLQKGGGGIYQASYALPPMGPVMVQVPYNIINKTGPSSINVSYTALYASNPAGVTKWINTQVKPWF